MPWAVVDAYDFEERRKPIARSLSAAKSRLGPRFQTETRAEPASLDGRHRKRRLGALGARAIRLNRFDNQPDQPGKEHDERGTGQEEIYIPVEGAGILRVGGEEVTLRPGRFVLVSPEVTRQVVAGPEGLAHVVVGARPEP